MGEETDEPQNRLFVAGYPKSTNESVLSDLFSKYGEIKELLIKKSFCFVEYIDEESAQTAKKSLNDTLIEDQKIVVTQATHPKQNKNPRLFLTNLPDDITEKGIKNEFERFGNLKDILLLAKGFAFVEYFDKEEADKALEEMDGKHLKGFDKMDKGIVVKIAHKKKSFMDQSRDSDRHYRSRSRRNDFGRDGRDRRDRYDDRSRGRFRDRSRDRFRDRSNDRHHDRHRDNFRDRSSDRRRDRSRDRYPGRDRGPRRSGSRDRSSMRGGMSRGGYDRDMSRNRSFRGGDRRRSRSRSFTRRRRSRSRSNSNGRKLPLNKCVYV